MNTEVNVTLERKCPVDTYVQLLATVLLPSQKNNKIDFVESTVFKIQPNFDQLGGILLTVDEVQTESIYIENTCEMYNKAFNLSLFCC